MPFYLVLPILLLSSLAVFVLDYLDLESRIYHQLIVVLLVLLVVAFRILYQLGKKKSEVWLSRLSGVIMLVAMMFVQLLIVSSGGFYSPFLILVHLVALGLGFVVDLKSSLAFLALMVSVLLLNIRFDSNIQSAFNQDPWSVVLYAISFVAVIPVAQLLIYKYHFNDKITKIFKDYIQIRDIREEAILKGLREMVVVINRSGKILSVNEAFRRAINLSNSEIIFKPFTEVLKLTDRSGNQATVESLGVESLLKDQAARIIDDHYFHSGERDQAIKIDIQIRPVFNLEGEPDQVVLVINEPQAKHEPETKFHAKLVIARAKYDQRVKRFNEALIQSGNKELQRESELLNRSTYDLINAIEVQDHDINQGARVVDVLHVLASVRDDENRLAESLGVELKVNVQPVPNQEDRSAVQPKGISVGMNKPRGEEYKVAINAKWLSLLLSKLTEIAVLLSSENQASTVVLDVDRTESEIHVNILTGFRPLAKGEDEQLLLEYYGHLGETTNLRLGSGLEGYLAQTIAQQISSVIEMKTNPQSGTLQLVVSIPTAPSSK